jgi:uncharacterized protein (TIGR02147 family)
MKEQTAIQHLLRTHFVDLQSKNPSYSLRSYAKKVDVHVGALSSIMNGKRNVSRELAERIARKLLIDPQKRTELLTMFPEKRAYKRAQEKVQEGPRYLEVEASQFKMISEWEHYAVLSLMNCADFTDEPVWISKRLGITENRTLEVLKRLLDLQLIKRNAEDKLVRTQSAIRSSDDTVNLSLRKSHEVTLDLAKESLNRDGVHERDFTYVTMAIDPRNISEAKERIRQFQDELSDLLESGNRTEVYRFSTQLIPFTKLNQSKDKK